MFNPIKIAVDAMGGENSPKKVLKGIELHQKNTKDVFYNIFGDKKQIEPLINNLSISNKNYKIIHTENSIKDSDSPLTAAKKREGKNNVAINTKLKK